MERNWDNIITDPETGLPDLPSNMFWRVKETSVGYFEVRLIEKREVRYFIFWKKVKELPSTHYGVGKVLDKETIRARAEFAYSDWRSWVRLQRAKDLLGDYPPKSL